MSRWGITDLHRSERSALFLLRADHGGRSEQDADLPPLKAVFASLRTELAASGKLAGSGAHWVTSDELRLLRWLATLQRSRGRVSERLPPALLDSLKRCALALSVDGIALPYRAIARVDLGSMVPGRDERVGDGARGQPAPRPNRRRRSADIRGRAVSILRDLTIVSVGELAASGIAAHSIRSLCRDGYIERIRTGWYRPGRQLAHEMAA